MQTTEIIQAIQDNLYDKGYQARIYNWHDSIYERPSIIFDMVDRGYIEPVPHNAAAYIQDWHKRVIIVEFASWTERDRTIYASAANYLYDLANKVFAWVRNIPDKTEKKEKQVRTYNVSKDKDSYSQRDNKVNPNKSCNTTSMVMAASYMSEVWSLFTNSEFYKKYSQKFDQPEDCLQQYMLDVGLRPTFHDDLSKAFNQFVGKKVASFSMNMPLATMVKELKEGRPVVISGDFPKSDGKTLGHVVCLVGCEFSNDNKTEIPDYWIIDDPYGDTLHDWQGSGNDIKLTHDYFMKHIKEKGKAKKWAHIFSL